MDENRPLTDHEAALAARQTLRDEGLLPPATADDVANLEEEIGTYPRPTLSANEALRIAKGQAALPAALPPAAEPVLEETINRDLGLAARGSCEISDETWQKMKNDRARARNGRSKEN